MNVHKHIQNLLRNNGLYSLTDDDRKLIDQQSIGSYIFSKISSKKFRKWKLTTECENRIRMAIHIAVSQNKPIRLILPAGGYKLWSFPSAPEADWAEFFNIAHVVKYLAPIAAGYLQGVHLSYYLFTLLMTRSDNLSPADIKVYLTSLEATISLFKPYLPSNLKIDILKDTDFYEEKEYFPLLDEALKNAESVFAQFTPERKEKYLKSSRLNIKWMGNEDWTKLTEQEKEKKIRLGALYEVAGQANFFPRINDWVFDEDKIIIFPEAKKEFIGIGSTRTSVTKYWTGYGVLEKENNTFYERILSPSQFEEIKKMKHEIVTTSLIPLKNLKEIWVYPTRFDFRKSK